MSAFLTVRPSANPAFHLSGGLSVDGTAYAAIDVFAGSTPRLDFVDPVLAWGALFKNAGDAAGVRVRAFDGSDNLLGTLELSGIVTGSVVFRGFVTGGALADHLLFEAFDTTRVVHDLFGVDDIEFQVGAPVPEPGSLALLVLGIAGILATRRRRGTHA